MEKTYKILEGDQWTDIVFREEGETLTSVQVRKKTLTLEPLMVKPPLYTFLVNGKEILELEAHSDPESGDILVNLDNYPHRFHLVDPLTVDLEAEEHRGGGDVFSPMPGKIIEVKIKKGDKVEKGQTLLVMEAMKMQNEIGSETAGVVTEIFVSPGQTVEGNAKLVSIGGA